MPKGHTGDGFAQVRGKPLDGVQLRRPPCGRRARANPRHAPAHNPAALAWLASGRGAARNMSMHNQRHPAKRAPAAPERQQRQSTARQRPPIGGREHQQHNRGCPRDRCHRNAPHSDKVRASGLQAADLFAYS